jgi:prepilin-type N-terminal cleavage/methylation domain-containing protein
MKSTGERGFGLIEVMISATILLVVSASVFTLLSRNQAVYRTEQDYATAVQNARISLDTIIRYLRQSGNNPHSAAFASLTYQGDTLTIRSDLTGSQASANPLESSGDPDSQLTAAYEQITIRYDSDSRQIRFDFGYGEETLAENIDMLEFEFFDAAGAATTNMNEVHRVVVQLEALAPSSQGGNSRAITLASTVYLRSRAFSPFG